MAVAHKALLCLLAVLCFAAGSTPSHPAADTPTMSPAATGAPSPSPLEAALAIPTTANASASWVNSPNGYTLHMGFGNASVARPLLLRPAAGPNSCFGGSGEGSCFGFGFLCTSANSTAYQLGVFIITSLGGQGGDSYLEYNARALALVWSANPSRPVAVNATVQFAGGDLVLRDADGTKVWSSGTTGKPVAGVSMDGAGNLVLFDNKNVFLWESFDHPTNVLLFGQSLKEGIDRTGRGKSLSLIFLDTCETPHV